MKKYLFPFLVALSALSLAGAAAFFSVTGLSTMFGGAKMEVIIMASALEAAKLVTASFLHRYWTTLKWQMKAYLTTGVIIVMIITSAGIYGFLSNAYSTTSGKLQNIDAQIQLIEQKKTIVNSDIARLQENKTLKSERVKTLTSLRITQEIRLDSLYNRRQTASAKRVEQQIEQANIDISFANIEIDTLNNQIQRKSEELSVMDLEILNLKNSDVNGEVGPLKYIAKLTGKEMDSVVNFFILLLIFVFDPLAVSLIVATNIAFEREFGKKLYEINKSKSVEESGIITIDKELKQDTLEENIKEVDNEINSVVDKVEAQDIESQKKTEEVIRYVADESGEFKPTEKLESEENKSTENIVSEKINKDILAQIKAQGIEHNASYLNFLDVLFKNGTAQVGQLLPLYSEFLNEIKAANLKYTEKEVRDFLTICNLFKITDMSKSDKRIAKDYTVSKEIISLLSK